MKIDKLLSELGKWWLPNTPDHKAFGLIKKNGLQYVLELSDDLCENSSNNFNQIDKFDIIHGLVANQKITLVWSIINTTSNKYGIIFKHGLIGNHFDSINDIKFKSINFSCGKILNDWLSLTCPKKQINSNKFSLEYELPETILIKLIKSQLIIEINYSYNCYRASNEINFKSTPFISLKHSTEGNLLSYGELLNNADWLTKFLHICCWQPIEPNEINFDIDGSFIPINYFSGLIKQPTESISPYKIMSYKAIEKNIDEILDNWYENQNKYYVIGYVLAKLTDPDYNVPFELKFTQAIQAVESFHRKFFSLNELKKTRKNKLKVYLNSFISSFEIAEVDDELKILVKNKLSSLPDITLHDRVDHLKKALPQEIINDTIIDDKKYAAQIVRIRNLYTHWDKDDYPTQQQTHDYTESLRFLLVIAIFKQLGIDDLTIVSGIQPNDLFQRILKNRPI